MGVALKASYATIYFERISQATSCLDDLVQWPTQTIDIDHHTLTGPSGLRYVQAQLIEFVANAWQVVPTVLLSWLFMNQDQCPSSSMFSCQVESSSVWINPCWTWRFIGTDITCVEAVVYYMELSNYLVENILNWLKCLRTKKVMGKIFEYQIFCANVHNGKVNRAPSSPIIGHVQILSVQRLGHLGRVWASALHLQKFQAKFCIIIILANTGKIQSNVKAINLGCEQLE
jgi:hypothetical protein